MANELGLVAQPEHGQRGRVAVDDTRLIGEQQSVLRVFEDEAKALFGVFALGDVLADGDYALRPAVCAKYARDIPHQRATRTVGQNGVVFEIERALAGEHFDDVRGHSVAMLGRNEAPRSRCRWLRFVA